MTRCHPYRIRYVWLVCLITGCAGTQWHLANPSDPQGVPIEELAAAMAASSSPSAPVAALPRPSASRTANREANQDQKATVIHEDKSGDKPVTKTEPTGETTAKSTTPEESTEPPPQPVTNEAESPAPSRDSRAEHALDAGELADLVRQMDAIHDLDPTQRDALMESLRHVDPHLWPMLSRQFRATLGYEQQQRDREQQAGAPMQDKNRDRDDAHHDEVAAVRQADHQAVEVDEQRDEQRDEQHDKQHDKQADEADEAVASRNPLRSPTRAETKNLSDRSDRSDRSDPTDPSNPSEALAQEDTSSDPPASAAASAASTPQVDWREHLQLAIDDLKHASEHDSIEPEEARRRAVQLHILYLLAQRDDDALRPIDRLTPAEQEYWKHQLHALSVYLDPQTTPVDDRRAALALRELRQATVELASASRLDVRNLAFCTAVDGYGAFTKFSTSTFRPDQQVLLYVEVDNFSSSETKDGYLTELQGSYQVFDMAGVRVGDHTFTAERDVCQNRRRDYFIPYRIYMPKSLTPGKYRLQLTIEDLQQKRFGQSSIEFSIQ